MLRATEVTATKARSPPARTGTVEYAEADFAPLLPWFQAAGRGERIRQPCRPARMAEDTAGESLAYEGTAANWAKGVTRVAAGRRPISQSPTRTRSIAAAVRTCCRCVFASPT